MRLPDGLPVFVFTCDNVFNCVAEVLTDAVSLTVCDAVILWVPEEHTEMLAVDDTLADPVTVADEDTDDDFEGEAETVVEGDELEQAEGVELVVAELLVVDVRQVDTVGEADVLRDPRTEAVLHAVEDTVSDCCAVVDGIELKVMDAVVVTVCE